MRPYFWKTLSQNIIFLQLFLVVLSKISSQHGRCWKLNIWCISDIITSKLREKNTFLHHRNYSIASILLKLSTLQRARNLTSSSTFFIAAPVSSHNFLLQTLSRPEQLKENCFELIATNLSGQIHRGDSVVLKYLGDFYLLRNIDVEIFSATKTYIIVNSVETQKPHLYQLISNSWYESRYICSVILYHC